jgi:hypothetical protein
MTPELEHAIRETLVVAESRRRIRDALRAALGQGDDAAALRLARELFGGDDAEGDSTSARQHDGASGA